MPNRIIKESIRKSESIDGLSWFEEVFFYRLITTCDDYGRYDARLKILKSELFPLKDGVTLKQISDALNKLSTAGMVQVYEYDQKPYLQLTAWGQHQQIRNKKSKFPIPDGNLNDLQSIDINCNQSLANVPVIQSESNPNPESKSISAGARNFTPPTVEEVREYCQERNNGINPERWHDFYTSKGWVVGKSKMKDWKASVRTWERDKKQESDNPFA